MKKISTLLGMIVIAVLVLLGQQNVNADEVETTTKSEETTTKIEETTTRQEETIKAGWVKTNKGYKYRYSNGKYAVYGFIVVDGTKYFIDQNGYRKSGIITYRNQKYYTVNGALYSKNGIFKYNKSKYYSKQGVLQKGLKKVAKSYYYFDKKNYKMVKNKLIKLKGRYYKFSKSGKGVKKSKGAGAAIDLIKKITSTKDSKQTKLRKGFNYMVKNYRYAVKPGYFVPKGKGWEESFGYNMIKTHSGRCYSFAAAFCLYAREVGYQANAIAGKISGNIPHAWCEVKQGKVWYTYDPDLASENKSIGTYYRRTYGSMGSFYRK